MDRRPRPLDVLGNGEQRLIHRNNWGLSRVDKLCDFLDDIQRVFTMAIVAASSWKNGNRNDVVVGDSVRSYRLELTFLNKWLPFCKMVAINVRMACNDIYGNRFFFLKSMPKKAIESTMIALRLLVSEIW